MAIIDIKLPNYIAKALKIPVSDPKRQQLKVLKKLNGEDFSMLFIPEIKIDPDFRMYRLGIDFESNRKSIT